MPSLEDALRSKIARNAIRSSSRRGKQVGRGFGGKYLVKYKPPHICECSIVGKCTRLIIERPLVQVQSFAPPERELRRLTSSKSAFVIRRTCQAIIDESPFYMGVQPSWSRHLTVNQARKHHRFESCHSRHGKPGSLAKNRLGNADARVLWLISGAKPIGKYYPKPWWRPKDGVICVRSTK